MPQDSIRWEASSATRWQEWNGRFRDDVRRFLKGDNGSVSGVAARILGSPDIYGHEEREAEQSINFVTCHDGFTLNDLVSYNHKHNEANGENNRDGSDDNLSWNCGAEGPTDDPTVEALRNRQVKNFFVLELLAAGTPMLLMGDEVRRTQQRQQQRLLPGLRYQLVRLEPAGAAWRHPPFRQSAQRVSPAPRCRGGRGGAQPQSTPSPGAHRVARSGAQTPGLERPLAFLAFTLRSLRARFLLHGMLNAYWEPLTFELPPVPAEHQQGWRRCIDTALDSPDDISPWESAPVVRQATYLVQPRSMVFLARRSKEVFHKWNDFNDDPSVRR